MDGWLRPVAEWNPLTRVLGVARQGFVGGPEWSTTLVGIAAMAVLAALTALFAFTGLRRLDS
jgi:ABC-type polysaccharide/polyol phosphate export permease